MTGHEILKLADTAVYALGLKKIGFALEAGLERSDLTMMAALAIVSTLKLHPGQAKAYYVKAGARQAWYRVKELVHSRRKDDRLEFLPLFAESEDNGVHPSDIEQETASQWAEETEQVLRWIERAVAREKIPENVRRRFAIAYYKNKICGVLWADMFDELKPYPAALVRAWSSRITARLRLIIPLSKKERSKRQGYKRNHAKH